MSEEADAPEAPRFHLVAHETLREGSKVPHCRACGRPLPGRNRAKVGSIRLGDLCRRCLRVVKRDGRTKAGSRLGLNLNLGGQKLEEWAVPLHVWFRGERLEARTVPAPRPHSSRLERVRDLRARGVLSTGATA